MKRILTGTMIALALATIVHAQAALTGKWQGETPSGSQIVLDVKATETALAGTLTYNGQRATIADGKVSKNTLTFKAPLGGQTEGFAGELAGDQITFWPDRLGRPRATLLKRVMESALAGTWQGTTASGRSLMLDLKVNGQQLTGRLTLAQQSADITESKVEGQTFSFTAGPLDGRTVACKGRLVGEEVGFCGCRSIVTGCRNSVSFYGTATWQLPERRLRQPRRSFFTNRPTSGRLRNSPGLITLTA